MSEYRSSKLRNVKCSVCGKKFFTDHPSRKTCSIECSMLQQQITFKNASKDSKRYKVKY